jgi:outer membrane receptor protein involved in Fe transport
MQPAMHRRKATALATAFVLAAVPPAFAQDAKTNDTSKDPKAKTLQSVTVTAQKKAESELDVPLSMSVLESSNMLATGLTRLSDYYAQIPGLSINDRGSGRTTLVIRGISAGPELNPTVGLSIDDAPFGSSTTDYSIPDLDPFDLDHIEVLRGPQGTLYGASSMGGLIKFVMANPSTDGFSGRVQTDVSSVEHGSMGSALRAAVNIPLTNNLAVRISAFDRHDAGFMDDTLQNKKNINQGHGKGGRLAVLWRVSDRFTLRASALAQNTWTGSTTRVDMQDDSYTPIYGPYAHARLPGTDTGDIKVRMYTLQLDGNLGWANLASVTSYNQYRLIGPQDVTGTFATLAESIYGVPDLGVKIINNNRTGKLSQEFRLTSPDDGRALSWLGGAFFTREHTFGLQDIFPVDATTGQSRGLDSLYDGLSPSTFKEVAGFGSATYAFTDALDVQLGGRFSAVRQHVANAYSGPLNGGDTFDSEEARNHVWTYSFGPRYHFSPDVMTYFRVATGYRAGGTNTVFLQDQGNFPTQYKSDTLTSYEWGAKGDFADHALTLDAALFYIAWKDIQLSEISPLTAEDYFVNAGGAKSQGGELTFTWRPLHGLSIVGNTAYTDAVLTRDAPNGTYAKAGDRLPYSPKWSANLSADYSFPLSAGLDGNVGAGISYIGDRASNFSPSASVPRFDLRAYTTAELHAGIQSLDWSASLYVRNLTDAKGYLSAMAENVATGASAYGLQIIQPRTVGLSVTYSF